MRTVAFVVKLLIHIPPATFMGHRTPSLGCHGLSPTHSTHMAHVLQITLKALHSDVQKCH